MRHLVHVQHTFLPATCCYPRHQPTIKAKVDFAKEASWKSSHVILREARAWKPKQTFFNSQKLRNFFTIALLVGWEEVPKCDLWINWFWGEKLATFWKAKTFHPVFCYDILNENIFERFHVLSNIPLVQVQYWSTACRQMWTSNIFAQKCWREDALPSFIPDGRL